MERFELVSEYEPRGDQPRAIEEAGRGRPPGPAAPNPARCDGEW